MVARPEATQNEPPMQHETTPLDINFRLGGIPITIQPWFWAMGLFMGMNLPGQLIPLWIAVVFVSVLVHELGHALAARAFGSRSTILLYSFGGLTFPERRLKRNQEIILSLAGPGAGFLLAAVVYGVTSLGPGLSPLGHWTLGQLLWVNVAWGIMNLLPVHPLDGGHVLEGILGPRRRRTVHTVGIVAGIAVALFAWRFGFGMYVIVLFAFLAFRNYQALNDRAWP